MLVLSGDSSRSNVVCIGAAGGNVACVLGLAGEPRKRSMLTLDVCVGDGGGLA